MFLFLESALKVGQFSLDDYLNKGIGHAICD